MLCLDAWVLPCFALVDQDQQCCTELFHTFSLDFFCCCWSITRTTRRLTNTIPQGNKLFIQGHGSGDLSIHAQYFSLLVRAPDLWSKCCEFESRRENFFSRVNFVCWLLFGVCSPPMLPQWHAKDPRHSAKSAGGRLHLNTHTPLTQ